MEAGRALTEHVEPFRYSRPIVLALPCGGVPIGLWLALALGAPLDVILARTIGVRAHPGLVLGAIAESGGVCMDTRLVAHLGLRARELEDAEAAEELALRDRVRLYREDRPAPDVRERTVLLADDGLSPTASVRAAARSIRARSPARIVLVSPIGTAGVSRAVAGDVDELVCAKAAASFAASGAYLDELGHTTDREVLPLLADARSARPRAARRSARAEATRPANRR